MHDGGEEKSVCAWRTLSEAISILDLHVTTAGRLPSLQGPADDNDTLTTVRMSPFSWGGLQLANTQRARLDELWTKFGVYAAKPTTMV